MRNMSTRMLAAVTAGAVLGTLALAGAGAPHAAGAPAAHGTQRWVSRYNGPGRGDDEAAAVATSPDGQTVFVTGSSMGAGPSSTPQYATIAYQASTGAQRWVRRYDNPGGTVDNVVALAVSSGGLVFVTGWSSGAGPGGIGTVAYSAASGAFQWAALYQAPRGEDVSSIAVSPDGTTVFITGTRFRSESDSDYLTVAYRAATGAQLWARRYNGPGNRDDSAAAVVPSPDGRTVFVTGTSAGVHSHDDWATVAYRAATGARLWVKRHDGPVSSEDGASSLAVSPDGNTLYVTGDSWLSSPQDRTAASEYVTIAYGAATGARLWARHYQNGRADQAGAASVAVSPAGLVFVTGTSRRDTFLADEDYATIAYNG